MALPTTDYIQVLKDALRAGTTIKFSTLGDPLVADVVKWRAFRRSDKPVLTAMHDGWKSGRPYKIDPLPKRMSMAFADFLFNEGPLVTPSDDGDRASMTDLLRESRFDAKLRTAADICVSEREVWWRIYMDPSQSLWPIIEWHSRLDVRPLMYGSRCLAVAFVNNLGQLVANGPFYHHLEFHQEGAVHNALYRAAGDDALGEEVPLTEHPLTENITEEWTHGIMGMLAGQIRNEEEMVSIYAGLEDLLLDLNETHTIDAENFRLAGKKRAMIPKKYQDQAGELNAGEEIFWTEDEWDEMEVGQDVVKVMEYDYDGDSSIKRKDDLERVILTRAGLVKQLVDANANEGLAQTGTALRTRLLPGVAALEGKAGEYQAELPNIICRMAQVDAMPPGSNGGGHQWSTNVIIPPAVEVMPPLVEDEGEKASRHATLVGSDLESVEHAVAELHEDWSEEQRRLEVQRILANNAGYALADDGTVISPDGTGTIPDAANPIGKDANRQPSGTNTPARSGQQSAGAGPGSNNPADGTGGS